MNTEQNAEFDSSNGMHNYDRPDPWPPNAGLSDDNHYFWGYNGPPDPNGSIQPKAFFNC